MTTNHSVPRAHDPIEANLSPVDDSNDLVSG